MIVNKPSVFIYTFRSDAGILKEICAGMEEEGVFRDIFEREAADAETLARRAAEDSVLGCGIGVCENRVVLQIKGLPPGKCVEAYDFPEPARCRLLGANAARAIKKMPLR